ncbi:DUF4249 domain-containing protein [Arthrospiribacter ruber]|uniref:DUF4249 domain-containing protein n=1 Tax=Arthrospiribacter ruber TaxID=2487934 RepID=A0A951IVT9_9BACT|nr:DUF4249 domain-containing protein [Arthrospiribacter ruber]MBW3467144.1 DUF4249 domain-containing protein [Arthrospiribacter ruber]
MKAFLTIYSLLLFILLATGCRDPFEPEIINQNLAILVVEGYVEIDGISEITLSRTANVRDTSQINMVAGANVFLTRDSGNERWDFTEKQGEPGKYVVDENLNPNWEYVLHIWLPDGQRFRSKAMSPIITPEMEELGWLRDDAGVEIFVSTQGNNEAQYFLWSFNEDWIFNAGVASFLIFEEERVRNRTEEERIDRCWDNTRQPRIVLQNSARFDGNTILERELVRIPNLSEKLQRRYSIEVIQRAIDQEAFDFWEILRKNSDDIGGIFSPMPSLISGNIEPENASSNQKVIGHVSMGRSASKRIYIDNADVFPWRVEIPEYEFCNLSTDTIPVSNAPSRFRGGTEIPAREVLQDFLLIGYRGASRQCADCTLRGSNVRPEFWED